MNATKLTQFCGSAMVSVPTGGRKKMLKHSVASTDAVVDSAIPHCVAISRIVTR